MDKGKLNRATEIKQVPQSIHDMKSCLASGFPFIFGIMIYPSFENENVGKTGNVPLPGKDEKIIGGHALISAGYDDCRQVFICQNSWGTGFGDKGYLYIPYDYMVNQHLCTDLWTIEKRQDKSFLLLLYNGTKIKRTGR